MVTITQTDSKVILDSPYHPDVPQAARNIGGQWDGENKVWVFNAQDYDKVVRLAETYYGYTPATSENTVTVRFHAADFESEGVIEFAGLQVAYRPTNESRVRLADNTILFSGNFRWYGGSRRYPAVAAEYGDNPVLEVRDIPESLLEKIPVEKRDKYKLITPTNERAALIDEKSRLTSRLQEINRLLEQMGEQA